MKPADPQPQSGALTSARAIRPTAAASSPAPITSGRPGAWSSLLSGTTRPASRTAASPTGRLIQKTQRQLSCTRPPPITGPSAAPRAPMADQVPMARARAGPAPRRAAATARPGTIRPAPTAWITRARDQLGHARGQTAQQRAQAEDDQAGDEEPAAPDPVGPPPGGHEHRGEDDRVAVEHPGQRAQAGARVLAADVGERQVDDEQVQAGHEHGQGQHAHDRGHPAGAGARRRAGRRSSTG